VEVRRTFLLAKSPWQMLRLCMKAIPFAISRANDSTTPITERTRRIPVIAITDIHVHMEGHVVLAIVEMDQALQH